jgi:hypothetical protein
VTGRVFGTKVKTSGWPQVAFVFSQTPKDIRVGCTCGLRSAVEMRDIQARTVWVPTEMPSRKAGHARGCRWYADVVAIREAK